MKALRAVALLFSLSSYVLGQQLITTTNLAGETIVEQITTNAFGQPLTQILQTLGPGTTSVAATTSPATTPAVVSTATSPATSPTTTAAADTTTPQVVGQPGTTPETPGGPTPFVYTTTDANGDYTAVSATFTPNFPSTTPVTPTGTGTVLNYSQYLSQLGTNTAASNKASQAASAASRASANISLLSCAVLSTILAGVVGGWVIIS